MRPPALVPPLAALLGLAAAVVALESRSTETPAVPDDALTAEALSSFGRSGDAWAVPTLESAIEGRFHELLSFPPGPGLAPREIERELKAALFALERIDGAAARERALRLAEGLDARLDANVLWAAREVLARSEVLDLDLVRRGLSSYFEDEARWLRVLGAAAAATDDVRLADFRPFAPEWKPGESPLPALLETHLARLEGPEVEPALRAWARAALLSDSTVDDGAAARVLSRRLRPGDLPEPTERVLASFLDEATALDARAEALAGLAERGSPASLAFAERWLTDDTAPDALRAAAAAALARAGGENAVDVLEHTSAIRARRSSPPWSRGSFASGALPARGGSPPGSAAAASPSRLPFSGPSARRTRSPSAGSSPGSTSERAPWSGSRGSTTGPSWGCLSRRGRSIGSIRISHVRAGSSCERVCGDRRRREARRSRRSPCRTRCPSPSDASTGSPCRTPGPRPCARTSACIPSPAKRSGKRRSIGGCARRSRRTLS